jgi:Flp pilus assembly CpaE family ATPase
VPDTIRVLTIVPDQPLSQALAVELAHLPDTQLTLSLSAFPDLDDLRRTIRVHRPDVLILDVESPHAEALLRCMDQYMPGLPMVGIAHQVNADLAHKLLHWGIREYLEAPITADKVRELLDFVRTQIKNHPQAAPRMADLYTFFPAKPGCGTTTIALSSSCALAEELSVRTLLLDCDLAAGIVNFHLKLGNSASVLDAIGHAENLDEDLWRQMVGRFGHLEVLHAGGLLSPPPIQPAGLQRFLADARLHYEVICADLGSYLDEFSIELMRESRRIFLVTTPEVAAVHLAQARGKSLSELGLADRVSLVLNRKDAWRGHLNSGEVAEATGMAVAYCLSNDYQTCSDATLRGSPVPRQSDLGQSILNLANSMRHDPSQPTVPAEHRRRFLEFFHVSPVADPATPWRG